MVTQDDISSPPRIDCEVHRRMSVRSSPSPTPPTSSPELPWSPSLSASPRTIVLGLWPYATHEQIQYYVQGYASLYPSANLLLLRYSRSYDEQLGNALDALTTINEKQNPDQTPDVLLHLFGGCGAAHGCRLLRAYKIRTGQKLGIKAIVLDSVPKVALPTVRASLQSPRLLFNAMFILMTVFYIRLLSTIAFWTFDRRCQQNRRDLNDPDLLPEDARKCYIFAEKDIMFTWQDTARQDADDDDDDEEDERQDFAVKRTSIDEDGSRWTGDQERYWLGIENVWEGR